MNQKLYLGIMSFFAVVFTITIIFLPYYNPIYFYLQHISLFLFMAMFIYFLLKLGYDRLEKRVQKTILLKGYTMAVFVGLLFVFSTVQLYAIERYQTPSFESCFYYDVYGNAIYYSQLTNSCPDLVIKEQTPTYLSFEVVEENEGNDDYDYMEGVDLSDIDFTSTLTTYGDIYYDNFGDIIDSSIIKFSSIKLEDGRHILNMISSHVENEIIYDGDDPIVFESRQSTRMSDDVFSSYYDPSAADEGVYVKYVSTKTYDDNNANTLEDMFQILISKEVYEDADFSGEPMEVSVIQQLDFICDDFQCSVLREDINVPLSDYVTLQDTDAFVSDLDYSYLITSNQVEIQYPYYHYQDTEKSFTTIRYSNFKDYQPLFFEHNTKSYTNFFNRPIERETFKYGGNDYLEHGDYYSIIYKMDYGFKVVNKLATMEGQTSFDDMLVFSSSVMFDADHFYRVENIYDYGLRASYNLSERDEIIYQENPLIFSLFEIVD